jgi:hypothetical protein
MKSHAGRLWRSIWHNRQGCWVFSPIKWITLRLEAHANGWAWEFAYWHGITLE